MPQADIIIVNWNSGDQLRKCLASIADTATPDLLGRVVVVDNDSSDHSLDGLADARLPLLVIRNSENRGFAAACNQGAAAGTAEYVLFLNPDTRLNDDSLTVPVTFLSDPAHGDVGICGIQLLDEQGDMARSCSRLPTAHTLISQSLGLNRVLPRWFPGQAMADWDHCSTRTVDQVIGAFFVVRRSLFERLGGFDEQFYVYFEEVDFSLRARAAGGRTVYLTDAQAYHRGGGTSEQAKARRLFYSLRSRILYSAKHFSKSDAVLVAAATLLVEPWTRLVWSAARLAPREAWETVRGFSLLWADLPRILATAYQRPVARKREPTPR